MSGDKPPSRLLDWPRSKLTDPLGLAPLSGSTQPVSPPEHRDCGLKWMQGLLEDQVQNLLSKEQALQAEIQTLRSQEQASQAEIQTLRAEVKALRAELAREQARAGRGPAPATEALFEAAGAYSDSGEDVQANMHPGTLAQAMAKYAEKIRLPSAHLLKPNGGTAHTLMNAFLRGVRGVREYNRR
jgi:hypothetical protein